MPFVQVAEGTGLEPVPRINEERFSKPLQYQLCLTLHKYIADESSTTTISWPIFIYIPHLVISVRDRRTRQSGTMAIRAVLGQ